MKFSIALLAILTTNKTKSLRAADPELIVGRDAVKSCCFFDEKIHPRFYDSFM
jgi:hypothetical protein